MLFDKLNNTLDSDGQMLVKVAGGTGSGSCGRGLRLFFDF
jgi:hypothetical protein